MTRRSIGARKATCPECRRRVEVFWHGRLIFAHHRTSRRSDTVCPGSAWLVEAEDMDPVREAS